MIPIKELGALVVETYLENRPGYDIHWYVKQMHNLALRCDRENR